MDDSQWWFLDLAIVIAVSGALAFALFVGVPGPARIVLALPLICFLPGYALVSVLYPDEPDDDYRAFDDGKTGLSNPLLFDRGLEPIERFVLSVVFSVAIVPAIALITTATPRGVTAEPVLSGLALVTVVLTVVAIGSRYRCPPARRFSLTGTTASPFFTRSGTAAFGGTDPRPFNVAIAIGFVVLLASAGFALANPPTPDGFTEFAVETEPVTGDVDTVYESSYTQGESTELPISITNREHDDRTYTTVALLERVSDDGGEVTVEEREELTRETVTVADGETEAQSLEITPTMRGDDLRLTVLLYEGEPSGSSDAENAYRAIHLPVEVS